MKNDELLHKLYYELKNYDGINSLYRKAKEFHPTLKIVDVKDWLNSQSSYQQTKPEFGKRNYLPIYSETPYSFQIDLTFFPKYTKQNKGYDVLFTAININTRFAYAYIGKDKSMTTIKGFIHDMEKKTNINSITCDKGKEFNNREFIKFCQDNNISLYFVKGDSHKMGIVNRFHRTIKDKLTKHFIASNTVNWVDSIDDIINNYNNDVNRGIGVSPKSVNNGIENIIINSKRDQTEKVKGKSKTSYDIDDTVLVKRNKKLFEDKQLSKYIGEHFKVINVFNNAIDVKGKDGNILRVKKSDVQKIKQNGEVLPTENAIIKANDESKQSNRLIREGVSSHNILNSTRIRKQRQIF